MENLNFNNGENNDTEVTEKGKLDFDSIMNSIRFVIPRNTDPDKKTLKFGITINGVRPIVEVNKDKNIIFKMMKNIDKRNREKSAKVLSCLLLNFKPADELTKTEKIKVKIMRTALAKLTNLDSLPIPSDLMNIVNELLDKGLKAEDVINNFNFILNCVDRVNSVKSSYLKHNNIVNLGSHIMKGNLTYTIDNVKDACKSRELIEKLLNKNEDTIKQNLIEMSQNTDKTFDEKQYKSMLKHTVKICTVNYINPNNADKFYDNFVNVLYKVYGSTLDNLVSSFTIALRSSLVKIETPQEYLDFENEQKGIRKEQ